MDIEALQAELFRSNLFWAAIELISVLIGLWVLYRVLKAAVREGIKESGLVETLARAAAQARPKETGRGVPPTLTDIRID